MRGKGHSRKTVSIGYELLTLQHAVEAATALVEQQRQGGLEDEDIEGGVSALMALIACRLRDLGRVA